MGQSMFHWQRRLMVQSVRKPYKKEKWWPHAHSTSFEQDLMVIITFHSCHGDNWAAIMWTNYGTLIMYKNMITYAEVIATLVSIQSWSPWHQMRMASLIFLHSLLVNETGPLQLNFVFWSGAYRQLMLLVPQRPSKGTRFRYILLNRTPKEDKL